MSAKIIFVDDELHVLDGLRRMLRSVSKEWDLRFAESGEAALAMLEQQPADVIVSDMRMPRMDGAELLRKVKEKYPGSVRIILSGYADEEAILRTVGPAHQYLAKPCDSKLLISTINRALGLRKYLASPEIQRLVASVERLPTLPKTYFELTECLQSPNASAAAVAKIIEKDVAMLAQTLKLTNSAYFGLPTTVESPLQAVRLLGYETIRSLVLMIGLFDQFKGDPHVESVIGRLSERSNSIGAVAKSICQYEKTSPVTADHAFTAGLLSHVGTLVMLANERKRFLKAMEITENGEGGIVVAEKKIFGMSHAGIGAYLLGLWGFNDPIVESVAFHHEPMSFGHPQFSALSAVHAAQFLTHCSLDDARAGNFRLGYIDLDYFHDLGLDDHLDEWAKIATAHKAEAVM